MDRHQENIVRRWFTWRAFRSESPLYCPDVIKNKLLRGLLKKSPFPSHIIKKKDVILHAKK
jgi:hypothetical protein